MIDIQAALDFLNTKLWNDEKKAFKEAIPLENYWQNDNWLAWATMRKFYPERALQMKEFLKDYWDTRWCIMIGDTKNFHQPPTFEPAWYSYADLVALQHIYYVLTKNPESSLTYGVLKLMYDGQYMHDRATFKEGCTTYKLSLFSMCAIMFNDLEQAERLLETISQWQVKEGEELGGVKTENVMCADEQYRGDLRWLANCETTCLALLAQDFLNRAKANRILRYGIGVGGAGFGIGLLGDLI